MFRKGDSMGKCLEEGIVWEMFRKGDSMGNV